MSRMASPSAIRPVTWAVMTGEPSATGEAAEIGSAFRRVGWDEPPGFVLGVADGVIAGNSPEALPAPMSRLASAFRSGEFRFGIGPSGSTMSGEALADDLDLDLDLAAAVAAVTVVLSSAAGGVHLAVVVTLAVAVSVTELTEDASEATAICALRSVACLSVTEPSVHDAVSFLLQPLVNSGFWLVGAEVSATVTPDAEPFSAETFTS